VQLQGEMNRLLAEYRELDVAPTVVKLKEGFRRLKAFQDRIVPFERQVGEEIGRWNQKLDRPDEDPERIARERAALQARAKDLDEVHTDLQALRQKIERSAAGITENRPRPRTPGAPCSGPRAAAKRRLPNPRATRKPPRSRSAWNKRRWNGSTSNWPAARSRRPATASWSTPSSAGGTTPAGFRPGPWSSSGSRCSACPTWPRCR